MAATWSLPAGVVTIEPLETISQCDIGELVADAADVLRFLGLPPRPIVWR